MSEGGKSRGQTPESKGSEGSANARGRATAQIVACPICRKSVAWTTDNPHRPFCSDRCRLIDLGAWASGERYIPGDPAWDGSDLEDS